MIITFLGHRDIYNHKDLFKNVQETIKRNITTKEKIFFFCGGYGDFDNICISVCHSIKKDLEDCEIVYVTPYMTELQQKKIKDFLDLKIYDTTIYPPLENVPPRYAISARNKWIIDQADLIIAYVEREYAVHTKH